MAPAASEKQTCHAAPPASPDALTARRLEAILDGVNDGIAILNRDLHVTYMNPAARRLLRQDVTGQSLADTLALIHPEDRGAVREVVAGCLKEVGSVRRLGVRLSAPGAAGWHDLEGTFTNRMDDPAVDGVIVNMTDVTERRRNEERLMRMALRDPLTDLPNRVLLMDRLTQSLSRCARGTARPALLFFDLDRFKVLNDTLGHAFGDSVLLAVSERIRPLLRSGDTLARLGGDEFAILCEDVSTDGQAAVVAQRILGAFALAFVVNGAEIHLSTSIGVALADGPGTGANQLLADADAAMYQAKERGRGRCEIFDVALRAHLNRRLEMEHGLHQALSNRELVVHYQPVFTADGNRPVGVEALVRWRRGEEMIPPGDFIGIAEETGLIAHIDEFVLEAACRQLVDWDRGGLPPLQLGVNLSSRHLSSPTLLARIGAILDRTGLPPERLLLEVTESAVMEDLDTALRTLRSLREIGVSVGVDDFGTGFSSLSYLRELPVDVLKIDRSFVAPLGSGDRDQAVVQAIVDLAHSLGLRTVGEGVETSEQLRMLRDMGCDFAQGFHLFRPVPPAEIPALGEPAGR